MTEPQGSNPPGRTGEAPAGSENAGEAPRNGDCAAVVGIGASAGGLEALKRFLKPMPADTGLAFVVVPHLDPNHPSLMAELLAGHTPMPVCEVDDGMAIEANRVYVIPSNHTLSVDQGVLRLSESSPSAGGWTAIDGFLRSLADAYQERAIGIVLSGTGGHGTLGLAAIKGHGGLAVAQEPSSAEYGQMPRSVIAAGIADYVLVPEAMADALVDYLAHACRGGGWQQAPDSDEATATLGRILALLQARTHYDFRCYRKTMLLRRVWRRMSIHRIDRLADYLVRLRTDADEAGRLFGDLLIGVTGFFRDPAAYAALAEQAIDPLVTRSDPDLPVRIWVPGCSTGEEAYSIAILVLEACARRKRPSKVQIFATDIDHKALAAARRGSYPESIAGELSAERLQRFFTKTADHRLEVVQQLREAVTFAPQNLISDAPFSRLDLVSCRNLLIYLEPRCSSRSLTCSISGSGRADICFSARRSPLDRARTCSGRSRSNGACFNASRVYDARSRNCRSCGGTGPAGSLPRTRSSRWLPPAGPSRGWCSGWCWRSARRRPSWSVAAMRSSTSSVRPCATWTSPPESPASTSCPWPVRGCAPSCGRPVTRRRGIGSWSRSTPTWSGATASA